MNHPTESDKATGQHLAKMVTAADTPNYRRVLADNERYLAVEVAALCNEARAPSSDAADKARHFESALEDLAPALETLRMRIMAQASENELTQVVTDLLRGVLAALAGSSAPTAASLPHSKSIETDN